MPSPRLWWLTDYVLVREFYLVLYFLKRIQQEEALGKLNTFDECYLGRLFNLRS